MAKIVGGLSRRIFVKNTYFFLFFFVCSAIFIPSNAINATGLLTYSSNAKKETTCSEIPRSLKYQVILRRRVKYLQFRASYAEKLRRLGNNGRV